MHVGVVSSVSSHYICTVNPKLQRDICKKTTSYEQNKPPMSKSKMSLECVSSCPVGPAAFGRSSAGPNGGLIAHCLLSSTGPVVLPAIWMLLPHCLSRILQLWDGGDSVKEIKIEEIKAQTRELVRGGCDNDPEKMCMLSLPSLSNLTPTTNSSSGSYGMCLVLSEAPSSKQISKQMWDTFSFQ